MKVLQPSQFRPPTTIELASESVTGEFDQASKIIGAGWTVASGVSSWCMLLVSFELSEL